MIRLIAFNQTSLWNIAMPENCKMLSVYAYDDDKATYCCEITPSRECHFLGTIPTEVPEGEEEREKFLDQIMEEDGQTESIAYYHCSDVDSRGFVNGCDADNDEDEEDNAMENTEENFRCNESNYEMGIINLFKEEK